MVGEPRGLLDQLCDHAPRLGQRGRIEQAFDDQPTVLAILLDFALGNHRALPPSAAIFRSGITLAHVLALTYRADQVLAGCMRLPHRVDTGLQFGARMNGSTAWPRSVGLLIPTIGNS